MASSCSLCAHPGIFLVKILEQMSMVNFMDYSLGTTAEGFVPSHAPLKNNKHLSILSSQRKEKQVRITRPNFFFLAVPVGQGEGVGAVPPFCQ